MIQAFCLGDWEHIMDDRPWQFRGAAVVLVPYDGFSKTSGIELFKLPIWIQIHELPKGYSTTTKRSISAGLNSVGWTGPAVKVASLPARDPAGHHCRFVKNLTVKMEYYCRLIAMSRQ